MKFVQAEPEVVVTYDELGDGWAKFAKIIRYRILQASGDVHTSPLQSPLPLRRAP